MPPVDYVETKADTVIVSWWVLNASSTGKAERRMGECLDAGYIPQMQGKTLFGLRAWLLFTLEPQYRAVRASKIPMGLSV